MARNFEGVKGLKIIHLFKETWKIGTPRILSDKNLHVVIYSPDDIEYHVYNKDIKWMKEHDDNWYETHDSGSPNQWNLGRVKGYILTHILDNSDFWNFDLEDLPEKGQDIKVIYDNGTIKRLIFSGSWEWIEIPKNHRLGDEVIKANYNKTIRPMVWKGC